MGDIDPMSLHHPSAILSVGKDKITSEFDMEYATEELLSKNKKHDQNNFVNNVKVKSENPEINIDQFLNWFKAKFTDFTSIKNDLGASTTLLQYHSHTIKKGTILYRMVKDQSFDWYPPMSYVKNSGRLNEEYESVFYTAFRKEVAMKEVNYKCLKKYKVIKDISAIVIDGVPVKHKEFTNDFNNLYKKWTELINKLFQIKSTGNKIIDDKIYVATNFLKDNRFFNQGMEAMGYIYPSVKMKFDLKKTLKEDYSNYDFVFNKVDQIHDYIAIDDSKE